jgi:acetyl-CoA carboxylase carboxyltransferase component
VAARHLRRHPRLHGRPREREDGDGAQGRALFVTAAALRVPVASVVLRRGYGLGAMALTAGHFHAPVATCAWPSGEFGAMGLEGAVRLGFRKELEAAPAESARRCSSACWPGIDRGQALNMASHLEIDEVIDPAETRDWLLPPRLDAGAPGALITSA